MVNLHGEGMSKPMLCAQTNISTNISYEMNALRVWKFKVVNKISKKDMPSNDCKKKARWEAYPRLKAFIMYIKISSKRQRVPYIEASKKNFFNPWSIIPIKMVLGDFGHLDGTSNIFQNIEWKIYDSF